MTEKPSYEELERRVQELEIIESEYKHLMEVSQENENLFKHQEKLDEINLIGNLAISTLDLEEVLRRILENVTKSVNASVGMIFLTDPVNGNITWGASLGLPEQFVNDFKETPIRIGEGLTGTIAQTGESIFIQENSSGDPRIVRPVIVKENLNSFLGVPIFAEDKVVGVMNILTRPPVQLKERDKHFCSAVGSQVGLAIINAKKYSELKETEKVLKESEALFRRMFKDHSAVMLLIDPKTGQIIKANQAATQYYGYSLKKMLQMKIEQLNILSPAEVTKEMRSALNKQLNIFEFQHKLADGQVRDVEVHSAPITMQQQTLLFSIIRDITERKRAEDALKESEERFNLAMDASRDGVYEWDLETREIYYSPGWKRMLGYKPDELPDSFSVWEKLTRPEDVEKSWQVMQEVVEGKRKRFEMEFEMRHKDGHWVHILSRSKLYKDVKGKPVRIVGTHVDITEPKQAEAERKKLQAQLNQAQKMESVGRLAGGVAHDFNNMLGVILGHTEMALKDLDPAAPLHGSLRVVQHAAERSAALTRQLLAFARKQTVAPKVVDINRTVEEILNMLRRLIGEDIGLLWQPGINLRPVKVDPSQLDQLLANLCVNARDAIAGVGKVTIETNAKTFDEAYCADHLEFQPGEYVLLEVSDDGCGMDKKTLNQIFEPFFTTKEMGKGTGLGLASVFGMVKQNNGFINVYSEPDQGTTFKIYLPAYTKLDGVMEKAPDLPTEHGNETILLVEDESTILEMTTMMLERLGYSVVAAASPGEAIRLAHEYRGRIDLLMTDVVMPEMNGRELAGILLSHYPDLNRLFMSGYTTNVIADYGVLGEDVHFIQKPFSMRDLAEKLRKALEG